MKVIVKDLEKKEDKKGDKYLCLTLVKQDDNKEIKGIIWSDSLKGISPAILKRNAELELTNYTHNAKYDNYDIKTVNIIKEGAVGLPEDQRKELLNFLVLQANTIKDEKLKDFTINLLSISNEILNAPAAKSHHHAFVGGLLVHTAQVLTAAQMLYTYATNEETEISYDLVTAGAICHDLYKIKEYKINIETGDIEIDKEWQKANKNHLRAGWAYAFFKRQPELAHIIESHHGLTEWGAEQTPQTKEAWIVFLADMSSVKLAPVTLNEYVFNLF